MTFFADRGRLPLRSELKEADGIVAEFGSLSSAFRLVVSSTNKEEWDQITKRREQEILLYCALSNFSKRPRIGHLPTVVQQDIKALFTTYKNACDIADEMLFSLGQPGVVANKCRQSRIGKLVPDGLYVHVSALEELDPILRLYEGCASRTVGRMEDATLVKFHIDKPKISYLFYPEFDDDPHPALNSSIRIDLRDLHESFSDYSHSNNPPVLHRKETFVAEGYLNRQKFALLTMQEEKYGLLDETRTIGTRNGWQQRLKDFGAYIDGHTLTALATATEEQKRLIEETIQHTQMKILEQNDKSTYTYVRPKINFSKTDREQGFSPKNEADSKTKQSDPVPTVKSESPFQKGEQLIMSPHDLRTFLTSKMSTTHIYQPVILLTLLENNGVASLATIAQRCAEIGGNSKESYESSLAKYPKQALTTHGVIVATGRAEFRLATNLTEISGESLRELIAICKDKLAKAKK